VSRHLRVLREAGLVRDWSPGFDMPAWPVTMLWDRRRSTPHFCEVARGPNGGHQAMLALEGARVSSQNQGCDSGYPVVWCENSAGHTQPRFDSRAIWDFFSQF
jgi:hypothetical protein